MKYNTCRHCCHCENCGAAQPGYSCNSFVAMYEVNEDSAERNRMRKELKEYTEAYRDYEKQYDDCDFY